VTEAFTQEWLDDLTRRVGATTIVAAAAARVGCVVTGGPDGETTWCWDFADGRLSAARLGPVDGADLTVTATFDDARAVVDGSLDASVAFMQGRLKSTGDTGLLFELLAAAPRVARGGARQAG
jgi:predicted lipid carrier protein YhbT